MHSLAHARTHSLTHSLTHSCCMCFSLGPFNPQLQHLLCFVFKLVIGNDVAASVLREAALKLRMHLEQGNRHQAYNALYLLCSLYTFKVTECRSAVLAPAHQRNRGQEGSSHQTPSLGHSPHRRFLGGQGLGGCTHVS